MSTPENHHARLGALRAELQRHNLDGFIIPIVDEYMSEYVGCCVSEGWGAVIAKTSDLAPLKQFAKKNQCSLSIRDKSNVDYGGKGGVVCSISQDERHEAHYLVLQNIDEIQPNIG